MNYSVRSNRNNLIGKSRVALKILRPVTIVSAVGYPRITYLARREFLEILYLIEAGAFFVYNLKAQPLIWRNKQNVILVTKRQTLEDFNINLEAFTEL